MAEVVAGAEAPKSSGSRVTAWLRHYKWFALTVILPVFVAAIYYELIAADIYISETHFVIKSPNQRPAQSSPLASLLQTSGLSIGQEQTHEVIDYLDSHSALADLEKRIDVRARFSSPLADWFVRYPTPFHQDRRENLYNYYKDMVSTGRDGESNVVVMRVKSYTPADAHDINARLLDLGEEFINQLNDRAQRKVITESQRRGDEAVLRLRNSRMALGQYRNQSELIDPSKQTTGVLEVANRLVSEQAALKAQLELTQRVAPQNPIIPSLQSRINAIGVQIAAQNGRAVGTNGAISSKLSQYENLALEQEFATQNLSAATAALEQARQEAQRQQFYLERISDPTTPDVAQRPRRIRSILTVAGVLLCLYFVGWMLFVGILEHSPED